MESKKRIWTIIALMAVIAGLFFALRTRKPSEISQPATQTAPTSNSPITRANPQNATSASSSTGAKPITPENLASRAASPNSPSGSAAETNEAANLPPMTVLDKARVVIHNYNAAFGENPIGTNPEITAALMGKNPKHINFFADSGLRVNEKGEMVDAYGTPFFFHQISGQEMEIRSAGQDHIMWTFDDLVTK